jgi:molybdopterin adenylyltransferase
MINVAVITISDSSAAGTRPDASGPALEARARELGWQIATTKLVPDEIHLIAAAVSELVGAGECELILCTGGTGLGPRDVTPEAIRSVAEREVPGFGEVMRAEGRKSTPFAALSRSAAYTRGTALILTFPGSPRGAVESLDAVAALIPHAVNLLQGRTEHHAKPQA